MIVLLFIPRVPLPLPDPPPPSVPDVPPPTPILPPHQSRIFRTLLPLAVLSIQMEEDPEYVFRFPDPEDSVGPPIIAFNDVSFNYPGTSGMRRDDRDMKGGRDHHTALLWVATAP